MRHAHDMINLGISFINKSLVIINLSGYFSVYPAKQTLTYRLLGGLGTVEVLVAITEAQPGNKRNKAKGNAGKRQVGKGKCWQYPLFKLKRLKMMKLNIYKSALFIFLLLRRKKQFLDHEVNLSI